MDSLETHRDPVDELAEEFVQRHRRGEVATVDEYIERFPHLAADLRQMLPAALMLERLKPTKAELSSSDARPRSGKLLVERLGDYRILREIGRGGMGVVYEAEQLSLGRRVALKVLPITPSLNPTLLQRFDLEARAAARLHHTNIVPVFGVGEDEGIHYYVMQYIHGQGLDAVLAELQNLREPDAIPASKPPLTIPPAIQTDGNLRTRDDRSYWSSVAWIGLQVADALQYAHSSGILHRDIKPSNLMLDVHGRAWITDFGLAKLHDQPDLTVESDLIGTIRYMAPERLSGDCDVRSDVYSLGLVLYELLTLRPAHPAASRGELVRQIAQGSPPPLRRIDARIPRDLETLVLKCIALRPADRYSSAGELSADLRQFLEDKPIRARRISTTERIARWCRRNPVTSALAGCVAALLLTLSIASMIVATRLGRLAAQQAKARLDADEARNTAEGTLAALYPNNAAAAGRRGDAGEASLWLAHAAQVARSVEQSAAHRQRALSWTRSAATPVAAFAVSHNAVDEITFDTTGRQIVLRSSDGAVTAWDIASGKAVAAAVTDWPRSRALGVDDGRVLISVEAEGLVWRQSSTRQTIRTTSLGEEPKWLISNAPGTHIAVGVSDQAKVFDALNGKLIMSTPLPRGTRCSASLSPDGMHLLIASPARGIEVWSVADGVRVETGLEPVLGVSHATFSPTGQHIAGYGPTGLLRVWALPSSPLPTFRLPVAGRYVLPRFDRIGRFIAAASACPSMGSLRGTQVFSAETLAPAGPVMSPGGTIRASDFSADGNEIITASSNRGVSTLNLWNFSSGQRRLGPVPLPAEACAVQSEPAGPRVAVRCMDGQVLVLDTTTGKILNTLKGAAQETVTLCFIRDGGLRWSPDGRFIVTWGTRDVSIFDAGSGARRYTLKHNSICSDVHFSRQGDLLATTDWEGAARIWDADTGQPAAAPLGHAAPSYTLRFVDDDRHLLSVCSDGAVGLWDWRGGRLVHPLTNDGVWFAADVSRDGHWAMTGNSSGAIRLWDLATRMPAAGGVPVAGNPWVIQFAPDGRSAAVGTSDSWITLVRLDAAQTAAPADQQVSLAWTELVASRRLHRGNIIPLPPADWMARWSVARPLAVRFETAGPAALAWHRTRASLAANAHAARSELFHLQKLMDTGDADWVERSRAAELLGKLNRWPDAAGAIASAVALYSDDPHLQLQAADTFLAASDIERAANAFDRARRLSGEGRFVRGNWWIAGPYPGGLNDSFAPDSQRDVAASIEGPNGTTERWRYVSSVDSNLDLHPLLHHAEHAIGYAQTCIYSPLEQTVVLSIGVDDHLRLWLNDEQIFESRKFLSPNAARVEVRLKAGINRLFAKVGNSRLHHRIQIEISGSR